MNTHTLRLTFTFLLTVYIAASSFRLVCVVVLVTDAERSYVGASNHGSFPPALALDLSLPSPLTSIR